MLTENQIEKRKNHIGASESSALMGLSPWANAGDIYLQKTGQATTPRLQSEAIDLGNMIESSLLDWASAETEIPIIKNQFRVADNQIMSATHDALATQQPIGFEAKTSGILRGLANKEEWGDAGTDQVPDYVLIQTHHQMVVSKLDMVYVPALLGGRGRKMYEVKCNRGLSEKIVAVCLDFWQNHVLKHVPPVDTPHLDVIKNIRRAEGKSTQISDILVSAWLDAKAQAKKSDEEKDQAEAALLGAMLDATRGESNIGIVTIKLIQSKRFDLERLKKEVPGVEKYMLETSYNRLNFKGIK